MKDNLRLILFLLIVSWTNLAQSQSRIFENADTLTFDAPDFDIMKKNGFNICELYEVKGEDTTFFSSYELNFSDSTMLYTELGKKKKRKTEKLRMYDDCEYEKQGCIEDSTIVKEQFKRKYEFDSFGRLIKSTRYFREDEFNNPTVITYFGYIDTTSYLRFVREDVIHHRRSINKTSTFSYEYENMTPKYYVRKCYHSFKYSYHKSESSSLQEVLLINSNGLVERIQNFHPFSPEVPTTDFIIKYK